MRVNMLYFSKKRVLNVPLINRNTHSLKQLLQ